MLRRRLPLLGPGLLLLQVRGIRDPRPAELRPPRGVRGCAVTGQGGDYRGDEGVGGSSRRGEPCSYWGRRTNPGERAGGPDGGRAVCGGGGSVLGGFVRCGGCGSGGVAHWGGSGSHGRSGGLGGGQARPWGGRADTERRGRRGLNGRVVGGGRRTGLAYGGSCPPSPPSWRDPGLSRSWGGVVVSGGASGGPVAGEAPPASPPPPRLRSAGGAVWQVRGGGGSETEPGVSVGAATRGGVGPCAWGGSAGGSGVPLSRASHLQRTWGGGSSSRVTPPRRGARGGPHAGLGGPQLFPGPAKGVSPKTTYRGDASFLSRLGSGSAPARGGSALPGGFSHPPHSRLSECPPAMGWTHPRDRPEGGGFACFLPLLLSVGAGERLQPQRPPRLQSLPPKCPPVPDTQSFPRPLTPACPPSATSSWSPSGGYGCIRGGQEGGMEPPQPSRGGRAHHPADLIS